MPRRARLCHSTSSIRPSRGSPCDSTAFVYRTYSTCQKELSAGFKSGEFRHHKSGGMKSGVSACALRATAWMTSCVTSRQVKASHRWWVCNKLHHLAISPEQGASIIVKISQQMAKLCQKLKWLVFSGTRCIWQELWKIVGSRQYYYSNKKVSHFMSRSVYRIIFQCLFIYLFLCQTRQRLSYNN